MTPDELITLRMVAFGIGWLDPWEDHELLGFDTIDSAPELELWAHRDVPRQTSQLT
jgi:hypothetical protein